MVRLGDLKEKLIANGVLSCLKGRIKLGIETHDAESPVLKVEQLFVKVLWSIAKRRISVDQKRTNEKCIRTKKKMRGQLTLLRLQITKRPVCLLAFFTRLQRCQGRSGIRREVCES